MTLLSFGSVTAKTPLPLAAGRQLGEARQYAGRNHPTLLIPPVAQVGRRIGVVGESHALSQAQTRFVGRGCHPCPTERVEVDRRSAPRRPRLQGAELATVLRAGLLKPRQGSHYPCRPELVSQRLGVGDVAPLVQACPGPSANREDRPLLRAAVPVPPGREMLDQLARQLEGHEHHLAVPFFPDLALRLGARHLRLAPERRVDVVPAPGVQVTGPHAAEAPRREHHHVELRQAPLALGQPMGNQLLELEVFEHDARQDHALERLAPERPVLLVEPDAQGHVLRDELVSEGRSQNRADVVLQVTDRHRPAEPLFSERERCLHVAHVDLLEALLAHDGVGELSQPPRPVFDAAQRALLDELVSIFLKARAVDLGRVELLACRQALQTLLRNRPILGAERDGLAHRLTLHLDRHAGAQRAVRIVDELGFTGSAPASLCFSLLFHCFSLLQALTGR